MTMSTDVPPAADALAAVTQFHLCCHACAVETLTNYARAAATLEREHRRAEPAHAMSVGVLGR